IQPVIGVHGLYPQGQSLSGLDVIERICRRSTAFLLAAGGYHLSLIHYPPPYEQDAMARRKTFDPRAVPPAFWRRDDVRRALLNREIGRFFGVYLATFPECTQTQLALLTGHDRSDISNFVRGVRSPRVVDIDVLDRIASGLTMPDEARVLLGLAPV